MRVHSRVLALGPFALGLLALGLAGLADPRDASGQELPYFLRDPGEGISLMAPTP